MDLEAHTTISSEPNDNLMLSASGSEELDVGYKLQVAAELPSKSVVFQELLEVVTCRVAKLT